jgi:hypothetical protein
MSAGAALGGLGVGALNVASIMKGVKDRRSLQALQGYIARMKSEHIRRALMSGAAGAAAGYAGMELAEEVGGEKNASLGTAGLWAIAGGVPALMVSQMANRIKNKRLAEKVIQQAKEYKVIKSIVPDPRTSAALGFGLGAAAGDVTE